MGAHDGPQEGRTFDQKKKLMCGVLSICATLSDFAYLPLKQWVQFDNEKFYLLNYVLLMCTPTTTLNLPLQ